MKKSIIPIIAAVLSVAAACTDLAKEEQSGTLSSPAGGVTVSFAQPLAEDDLETKSLDSGLKFYFAENEQFNVYSGAKGECMTYTLKSIEGNVDGHFFVNGFNLKDDDYFAVYPWARPALDQTAMVFSLAGQDQAANNDASGQSAFDLNLATATISDNSGHFAFEHKVAWLRVVIRAGKAATYKQVVVSAAEGIANTLTVDAVRQDVVATPSSTDEQIVLTLRGGEGIEVAADEQFVAYVTIPQGVYTDLTVVCGESSLTVSGETAIAAGRQYAAILKSKLSTPVANPAAGRVAKGTPVRLSSPEHAKIYYTLDGSQPTSSSTLFEEEIPINEPCTIKAIAISDDAYDSDVMTASYDIDYAIKPTISVGSDGYVTITSTMAEAEIRYEFGDAPVGDSSPLYDPDNKPQIDVNAADQRIRVRASSPYYLAHAYADYFYRPIEVLDGEAFKKLDSPGSYQGGFGKFSGAGKYAAPNFYMNSSDREYIACNFDGKRVSWIKIKGDATVDIIVSDHYISGKGAIWGAEVELLATVYAGTDSVTYNFSADNEYETVAIRPASGYSKAELLEVQIGWEEIVQN